MPDSLDVSLLCRWARMSLRSLGAYRAQIDALNVFPVPDGDTGTNLFLTFEAAAGAVEQGVADGWPGGPPSGVLSPAATRAQVAGQFASGALLGARGNSGVITSQILLGFARALGAEGSEEVSDARLLCQSLSIGTDLAYAAVGEPQEGTILTVIRSAAEAAATASALRVGDTGSQPVQAVARAALTGAEEALRRTPEQLEVLAQAGVVDAGGAGCVVMLEALVAALTGEALKVDPRRWGAHRLLAGATEGAGSGPGGPDLTYSGPEYEVMYLLDADADAIPELRRCLAAKGASLVVVGGDGAWNVHVHVDDIGSAIEAGIAAGRPYQIRVTRLLGPGAAPGVRQLEVPRKGRALVAVAHGPGVRELLEAAGAAVVMAVPGHRPSTSELLDATLATNAAEVIVLPSDSDTRAVAEAAADQARQDGIRVAVIPTRAIVQTLAAVAVQEDASPLEDDLVSMGRAAGATRYGAVTVAVRRAETKAGACQVGDILGLVEGKIVEIGESLAAVSLVVLDRLMGSGSELVTVVAGADATDELLDEVEAGIRAAHPELDVDVIAGGQPSWPLIFGVE